jgi:hypothetical protein
LTAAFQWAEAQPKNTIKLFVGDRAKQRKSRSPSIKKNKVDKDPRRALSKKERKLAEAFDPETLGQ